MRIMCRPTPVQRFLSAGAIFLLTVAAIQAQSTRPRRTNKQPSQTTRATGDEPLLRPEPAPSPTARRSNNSGDSLLDVQPVKPVTNTVGSTSSGTISSTGTADTKHAYLLL